MTRVFAALGWYYAYAHLLQLAYGRDVLSLEVVIRESHGVTPDVSRAR